MTGRDESKIKTERQNQKLIEGKPAAIQGFYHSMAHLSPLTKKQYLTQIILFFSSVYGKSFTNENILATTGDDINAYATKRQTEMVNGKIISKSIIAMQISAIRKLYNYLVTKNAIGHNPVDDSSGRPRVPDKDKITYLEYNEIQQVLHNLEVGMANSHRKKWKERDKAIFLLFVFTGIRRSALSNLDVGDVDFHELTLKVVDKGETYKLVDLRYMPDLVLALQEWIKIRTEMNPETEALFVSSRGRMSVDAIYQTICLYTSNLDKHITPHKLRSTFATNYYRASDGDILLTQAAMGHKNITTTQRYALPDKSKHRDVMLHMAGNISQGG